MKFQGSDTEYSKSNDMSLLTVTVEFAFDQVTDFCNGFNCKMYMHAVRPALIKNVLKYVTQCYNNPLPCK